MKKSASPSDQEQQEALALLRQGSFPGTPGPGTTRLHGRFATLSLTTFVTLNCFHWEIEFQQEFADATAHGDFWRVRIPITQDWSARVQGYLDRTAGAIVSGTDHLTYLSRSAGEISGSTTPANIGTDPVALTLSLWANDASGSNGPFFTGTCYVQRGSVLVPQAMVTQTLELVAATVPTKIV